jgi:hypothetical protein
VTTKAVCLSVGKPPASTSVDQILLRLLTDRVTRHDWTNHSDADKMIKAEDFAP